MNISHLLEKSMQDHNHLCPRQILGVRIGMAGMKALGFIEPPAKKQLLVITETDGCFADGVIAATSCTIGHRTLRVEDYGKTAATFVDTLSRQAARVAPALDLRQRACTYEPNEPRHYFAQIQAYQSMPDEAMFTVTAVTLTKSIEVILSRPGVRVNCNVCGEEIMNEREIKNNGLVLCRSCEGRSYYQTIVPAFALQHMDAALLQK
jgi:formylmethanofuran dehydrogenase subunit E